MIDDAVGLGEKGKSFELVVAIELSNLLHMIRNAFCLVTHMVPQSLQRDLTGRIREQPLRYWRRFKFCFGACFIWVRR